MESIYRRYYYSIRSYKLVIILLAFLAPEINVGQSDSNPEDAINHFLSVEFIDLLQKSRDYNSLVHSNNNLRNALSIEIGNLNISINDAAPVEYGKADRNGEEIIISDLFLPFLVNYAGKMYIEPALKIECIRQLEKDFHAYIRTTDIITHEPILSKVIFRKTQNTVELRRISFTDNVPSLCAEKDKDPNSIAKTNFENNNNIVNNSLSTPRPKTIIPKIKIHEASIIDGRAIVYGYVQNHKNNGFLMDIETGSPIEVSSRDGFFVLSKFLNSGHLELKMKYQYGQKFITDKKLLFIKPQ